MTLQIFLFFLFGLIFGSFGNVLVARLHSGESLGGRSHCMHCRRTLDVFDLVPIISYVLLGGRCRTCSAQISLQYPILELLSGIVFALAATLYPSDLFLAVLTASMLYLLLLASAFDVLHQHLPDIFTIIIGVLALIIMLYSGDILSSLFGVLVAVSWFGVQWLISRGRAVGSGDIFLAAALALWFGFQGTITMLLLSYMIGAVTILGLLTLGVISMQSKRIAFGPFLALGALGSLLGVGQLWMIL